jgi:hypothetical protein
MIRHHHSLLREAPDVGLLGAGTVAAWFLLIDWIAGHPLYTPSALGQILLFGRRMPEFGSLDWQGVAAYTFFHVLAFTALGVAVVWAVHFAIRRPTWLVALLILFMSAEVFCSGVVYGLLSRAGAESLWWSVVGANLLTVLTVGTYLWRRHRMIDRWLARVPLGDTGDEVEVNSSAAWHAMGRWRAPLWRRWTRPRAEGRRL